MNRRVAVTGVGVVSPFGVGLEAFRSGVLEGVSTSRPIRAFDATGLPTSFGCEVPTSYDVTPYVSHPKMVRTMSRPMQYGVGAARMAWDETGLSELDPADIGVIVGVGGVGSWDTEDTAELSAVALEHARTFGASELFDPRSWVKLALERLNPIMCLKALPNMAAAHIAIVLEARGESSTIATSCTSSTQAIGEAFRMIQGGRARAVIAGGCDAAVNVLALAGFGALGVLSKRSHDPAHASRPFDRDRDGFVLGAGAAFLVLEDWDEALRRGARVRAEIAGYASTNDGYRLTDEDPRGQGSITAIRRALAAAGVRPEEVDYINAHGTATRMNDATEARVITEVFGTRVPVSSTKSMIGHSLAAAGALEATACLVAIEAQKAPPTINLDHVDPDCALRHVARRAEDLPIRVVVKNSFGFGGQNACLVLRKP